MAGTLFVVDGRSASGKSELQRHLEEDHEERVGVIRKFTDRAKSDRLAAGAYSDQDVIDREYFDKLVGEHSFVWYQFSKYRYGFRLDMVRDKLENSAAFIIVRDVNVIARLTAYGASAGFRVVSVFIRASADQRKRFLATRGAPESEVNERLARDEVAYPPARESSHLYDVIIDNVTNQQELFKKFRDVVEQYRHRR